MNEDKPFHEYYGVIRCECCKRPYTDQVVRRKTLDRRFENWFLALLIPTIGIGMFSFVLMIAFVTEGKLQDEHIVGIKVHLEYLGLLATTSPLIVLLILKYEHKKALLLKEGLTDEQIL